MVSGSMIKLLLHLAGPHPRSPFDFAQGDPEPVEGSVPRSHRSARAFPEQDDSAGLSTRLYVVGMFLVLMTAAACQKVPLLAPSGSTIILTASNNAIPATGTAELIAQVLEPAGTPPHPGTHVTFTTTLGVIEPAEATTDINGRVRVTFRANGSNGTATITASSGGATTGTNGAVKISVGTAAVGRITLTANPTTISANGGSATINANVVDVNGNALVSAPVSFATSAGVLTSSLVTTDSTGNAQTVLTTSVEATVTATVGAPGAGTGGTGGTPGTGGGSTSGQTSATVTVKVNPLPSVTVAAQGTSHTVGSPVNFTVTVTAGANSTAQIKDVRIFFGDGDSAFLGTATGTIPIQHLYDREGTFPVTARVTDTLGGIGEGGTVIVVQGQVPVVTISFTSVVVGASREFTFTANVFPANTTIVSYSWNFGDGQSQTSSTNSATHSYPTGSGTKTVTVTVTRPNGQQSSSSTTVTP